MKLSVIVPCFNAAETIGTQLEALANQRWSETWEVVVSDNGSTDNTRLVVEQFRQRMSNLRIVDSSDRRGASHARNMGARAARGEALAFCDADDEVGIGWVSAIGEELSKHDFVASRWDIEKLNKDSMRTRGNPQETGLQILWYPPYLPHSGASGIGVKRALHVAVGGFDESLPALEDTDYCFRIQIMGVKFHFVPDAVVHVRFRQTLFDLFNQTRIWGQYNVFLYKKYCPPDLGVPQPIRRYLSDWKRTLAILPKVRHRRGRYSFIRLVGWQIGQLHGCMKYRSFPTAYPRKLPSSVVIGK